MGHRSLRCTVIDSKKKKKKKKSQVIIITHLAWIVQRFLHKHNILLHGGELQCKHVCIFKQMNKKSFTGLLQGKDHITLSMEPSITIFPTSVSNYISTILHTCQPVSEKVCKTKGKGHKTP